MKILDFSITPEATSNPETNREIRVAGECLPADFVTHKPRFFIQARQEPTSSMYLLTGRLTF
jgi:hypothetical protein